MFTKLISLVSTLYFLISVDFSFIWFKCYLGYTIIIKEHILGRYSEYDMMLLQKCDWLRSWFIMCRFGSQRGSSALAARVPFPMQTFHASLHPSLLPAFYVLHVPFPLLSLGLLWKGWGSSDKTETLHSSLACLSWEHHCMGLTFVILLLFQRKKLKGAVPSSLPIASLPSTLSEKWVIL